MGTKRPPRILRGKDVSDRDASPDEKLLVIPPALAFGVRYGGGVTARHGPLAGDVRPARIIKAHELAGSADTSAPTVERPSLSPFDEQQRRYEERRAERRADEEEQTRIRNAEIRTAALAEAERIERECEEAFRRERAEKLAAARQEGILQARREMGVDPATGTVDALEREENYFEGSLGIIRRLAEKLVVESIVAQPERTLTIAKAALDSSTGAQKVTLFAHPIDAKRLRPLVHVLRGGGDVTIEDDETLGRGSMVVQTELGGRIDSTLPESLGNLIKGARDAIRAEMDHHVPMSKQMRRELIGVLSRVPTPTVTPPAPRPKRG